MMKSCLSFLWTIMLAGVQMLSAQTRADVNFLVVSDIGDYGGGDQRKIAETIGAAAYQLNPTAILNLGDTFHYWGVQSVDDPSWESAFESMYSAPALHNLWYCVLGNHDYQGNTQALIDYTDRSRRWNLPDHYYTQRFKRGNTTVAVVFIDTTPLLRRAVSQPDIYPEACLQDTTAQIQWIKKTLASTDGADWVIVAAHHPLFSSRDDSGFQRTDINSHIGLALATERPDFYINGDVHCFEHIRRPGDKTDYVTCSSGSRAYDVTPGENVLYASGHTGYMTMTFGKDTATVTMWDRDGKKLYEFTKDKKTDNKKTKNK